MQYIIKLTLTIFSIIISYSQGFSLVSSPETDTEASRYFVWTEAGLTFQSRNDVEIPKGDATRFSITDFGKGPLLSGRVYAGWQWQSHHVRVLAAPLTLKLDGKFTEDVRYQGKIFAAGQQTEALYRFDSYRLTYGYQFMTTPETNLIVGFTAKIRDAEIRLQQANTEATKTNTGFVPLLHFAARYQISDAFGVMFDGDALASPYGRAEDVAILITASPLPGVEGRLGYRTIEGGSNGGGSVFSFAWFHSFVAGLSLTFD